MDKTLRSHVASLEGRLANLQITLTNVDGNTAEKDRITNEIQLVRIALDHYRRAYELEKRLQ